MDSRRAYKLIEKLKKKYGCHRNKAIIKPAVEESVAVSCPLQHTCQQRADDTREGVNGHTDSPPVDHTCSLLDWYVVDGVGQGHKLPKTMIFLGREECDITLQCDSVEKRHAVIAFDHYQNRFKIKDLSTANGTFVNGTSISEQEYTTLDHMDNIQLGQDPLMLHMECVDNAVPPGQCLELCNIHGAGKYPGGWSTAQIAQLAECKGCIAEQKIHHTCGLQADDLAAPAPLSSSPVLKSIPTSTLAIVLPIPSATAATTDSNSVHNSAIITEVGSEDNGDGDIDTTIYNTWPRRGKKATQVKTGESLTPVSDAPPLTVNNSAIVPEQRAAVVASVAPLPPVPAPAQSVPAALPTVPPTGVATVPNVVPTVPNVPTVPTVVPTLPTLPTVPTVPLSYPSGVPIIPVSLPTMSVGGQAGMSMGHPLVSQSIAGMSCDFNPYNFYPGIPLSMPAMYAAQFSHMPGLSTIPINPVTGTASPGQIPGHLHSVHPLSHTHPHAHPHPHQQAYPHLHMHPQMQQQPQHYQPVHQMPMGPYSVEKIPLVSLSKMPMMSMEHVVSECSDVSSMAPSYSSQVERMPAEKEAAINNTGLVPGSEASDTMTVVSSDSKTVICSESLLANVLSEKTGDIESLKKGTPLYGQPSWWGEDERSPSPQAIPSSKPAADMILLKKIKGDKDDLSVSPERPVKLSREEDWSYDPAKYKSDPKYSQTYMEISSTNAPQVIPKLKPLPRDDSFSSLSRDSLSPQELDERLKSKENTPERGRAVSTTAPALIAEDKTPPSKPEAFTVDMGDDDSPKMAFGESLSRFVPSKIRKSFLDRKVAAKALKDDQPVNNQLEEDLHVNKPADNARISLICGSLSDGHDAGSSDEDDDRSFASESGKGKRQNLKAMKSSKIANMKSSAHRSNNHSPEIPATDTTTYLLNKMFNTGRTDSSVGPEDKPVDEYTEHHLYKEAKHFDRSAAKIPVRKSLESSTPLKSKNSRPDVKGRKSVGVVESQISVHDARRAEKTQSMTAKAQSMAAKQITQKSQSLVTSQVTQKSQSQVTTMKTSRQKSQSSAIETKVPPKSHSLGIPAKVHAKKSMSPTLPSKATTNIQKTQERKTAAKQQLHQQPQHQQSQKSEQKVIISNARKGTDLLEVHTPDDNEDDKLSEAGTYTIATEEQSHEEEHARRSIERAFGLSDHGSDDTDDDFDIDEMFDPRVVMEDIPVSKSSILAAFKKGRGIIRSTHDSDCACDSHENHVDTHGNDKMFSSVQVEVDASDLYDEAEFVDHNGQPICDANGNVTFPAGTPTWLMQFAALTTQRAEQSSAAEAQSMDDHRPQRKRTGRKLPDLPTTKSSPILNSSVIFTDSLEMSGASKHPPMDTSTTLSSHISGKDAAKSHPSTDNRHGYGVRQSIDSLDTELLLRDTETVMAAMEARVSQNLEDNPAAFVNEPQFFDSDNDSDIEISTTIATVAGNSPYVRNSKHKSDSEINGKSVWRRSYEPLASGMSSVGRAAGMKMTSNGNSRARARKLSLPGCNEMSLYDDLSQSEHDTDTASVASDTSSPSLSRQGSKGKGTMSMTRPNRAFQLRRLRAAGGTDGTTSRTDSTSSTVTRTSSMSSSSRQTPTKSSTTSSRAARLTSRPSSAGTASDTYRQSGKSDVSLGKQIVVKSRQNTAVALKTTPSRPSKTAVSGQRSKSTTPQRILKTEATPKSDRSSRTSSVSSNKSQDLTVTGHSAKSSARSSTTKSSAKVDRSSAAKAVEAAAWKRRKSYDPMRAVAEAKARAREAKIIAAVGGTQPKSIDTDSLGLSHSMEKSSSLTNSLDLSRYPDATDSGSTCSDDPITMVSSHEFDHFNETSMHPAFRQQHSRLPPFTGRHKQTSAACIDDASSASDDNSAELSYGMLPINLYKSAFSPPKNKSPPSNRVSPISPPLRRSQPLPHNGWSYERDEVSRYNQSYDPLMISSIYQLSLKLKTATDRTLDKIREDHQVSTSPSPIDDIASQQSTVDFPAWNSANHELAAILKNLRKMEHHIKVINNSLFSEENNDSEKEVAGAASSSKKHYIEEIKRIRDELIGFQPIENPQLWSMRASEHTESNEDIADETGSLDDEFEGDEYY